MTALLPVFTVAALLGRNPVLVAAVYAEAEHRHIEPVVVCALVEHESSFRPWAKSTTHDYGLMQIHEPIHGRHRAPAANIRKGVDILCRELARERGDMKRALSRYNTGRVTRRGLAYADRVMRIAARLRSKMGGRQAWATHVSSSRLSQSDCWYGLWSVDYVPRRRRGLAERRA